jgi:hypothetical protein
LAAAGAREDLLKAEAAARSACMHPNIFFQNSGNRLRCVDCKRFWMAGTTTNGVDMAMPDFTYQNPQIFDSEFRHSPNELPRRRPVEKKIR